VCVYYVFLHSDTYCKALSLVYSQFLDETMSVLFEKLSNNALALGLESVTHSKPF